jgi:hypothetical protein
MLYGSSHQALSRVAERRSGIAFDRQPQLAASLSITDRFSQNTRLVTLQSKSSLHDERPVSWVKFFTHALSDGDGRFKFQTAC